MKMTTSGSMLISGSDWAAAGAAWAREIMGYLLTKPIILTLAGALFMKTGNKTVHPTRLDGQLHFRHQLLVVVKVVQGGEACAEDFAAAHQMVQVGAGKVSAGVAKAGLVHRHGVVAIAGVADAQVTEAREQNAVARIARGHYAIEHVDAALH